MSIFNDNIITPPSIITIGQQIQTYCSTILDKKRNLYKTRGFGIPSSVESEKELTTFIKANFSEKLDNNKVKFWRISIFKNSNGYAQVWFRIIFFYELIDSNDIKRLFEYNYYFT